MFSNSFQGFCPPRGGDAKQHGISYVLPRAESVKFPIVYKVFGDPMVATSNSADAHMFSSMQKHNGSQQLSRFMLTPWWGCETTQSLVCSARYRNTTESIVFQGFLPTLWWRSSHRLIVLRRNSRTFPLASFVEASL